MALTHKLADIRKNYTRQALLEAAVARHPVAQFKVWLEEAIRAEAEEPTAMVLSTVSAAGRPSARVVLLKDVAEDGYTFFTNYDSRKGRELAQNPYASLTFFWPELERQVRVEGKTVQAPPLISDTYFRSRPRASRIGAWASPQSREIESRQVLEQADKNYSEQFAQQEDIPRPAYWGGYLLQPDYVEFWQGGSNRLHDRIVYELDGREWRIKRLAP